LTDVLVLGAGLAGLTAARDLAAAGTDVLVLEARSRIGGRVEQLREDGRRPVQLGGEVVGPVHTNYLGLVEELGLSLEPSYTGVPGETTYDLYEGVERGADFPHRGEREQDPHLVGPLGVDQRVERTSWYYGISVGMTSAAVHRPESRRM
jgi:monoamine oxidase